MYREVSHENVLLVALLFKMYSVVFVTVGTTKFDKLIQRVTSNDVLHILKRRGCKRLILQIGNGGDVDVDCVDNDIIIEYYRFKDSISEDIKSADLVISHAGAGSCLETLEAGKPLLAIINEDLMNNHQIEVAMKLSEGGYLYYTSCSNLHSTLDSSDFTKLKMFPKRDPELFAKSLDFIMGFS